MSSHSILVCFYVLYFFCKQKSALASPTLLIITMKSFWVFFLNLNAHKVNVLALWWENQELEHICTSSLVLAEKPS